MPLRTKIKNQNNINIDTELDIISSKLGIEKQDIDFDNFDSIELAFEGFFTEIGKGLDTIVKGIKHILKTIWEFITRLFKPKAEKVIKRARKASVVINQTTIINIIQCVKTGEVKDINKQIVDECSKYIDTMSLHLARIHIISTVLNSIDPGKTAIDLKITDLKSGLSSIGTIIDNISDSGGKVDFGKLSTLRKKDFKQMLVNNINSNLAKHDLIEECKEVIKNEYFETLMKSSGISKICDSFKNIDKLCNKIEKQIKDYEKLLPTLKTTADKEEMTVKISILSQKARMVKELMAMINNYDGLIKTLIATNKEVSRESINDYLVTEMFCNYDNDIYHELSIESFGDKISMAWNYILDILYKIYSYIKNWHPIKRMLIDEQLTKLNKVDGNDGDFDRLNTLFNHTFSGLLFLCDYNLSKLSNLESSMFDIYYKFGSNPNPETLKDNICIKIELNNTLSNFINFKSREFCKDNNIVYLRHNLVTVYAKANIIYLYTLVYDNESKGRIAKFKYQMKETDKSEIDFSKYNNRKMASDLLNSHLNSLNKFRWTTESLNRKLKKNSVMYKDSEPPLAELSKSILEMVNCLNPKFYLIAMEYSKAMTKNIK